MRGQLSIIDQLKDLLGGRKLVQLAFAKYRSEVVRRYDRLSAGYYISQFGRFATVELHQVRLEFDLENWFESALFLGLMRGHEYEPGTTCLVQQLLREGDVFVDVGASMGYFSVIAAKKIGPRGHVYAFEPLPRFYRRLIRNSELNNLNNISAFNFALGKDEGEQLLHMSDDESVSTFIQPAFEATRNIKVPVKRIDNLLYNTRIRLIKMDVEGYEPIILPTLKPLLMNNPGLSLICEFNKSVFQRTRSNPAEFLDSLNKMWRVTYQILETTSGPHLRGPITNVSQLTRRTCNLLSIR